MRDHTGESRVYIHPSVTHPGGSPTGEVALLAQSGQRCIITGALGDDRRDREVGHIFDVRFDDGMEAEVYADEIGLASYTSPEARAIRRRIVRTTE